MLMAMTMGASLMLMSMNPIWMAMTILVTSLMMSVQMYWMNTSPWMSMVMVITFSSGMMTLFLYTTSLAPNEIQPKKKIFMATLLVCSMMTTINKEHSQTKTSDEMKTFSKYGMMSGMALILILTMLAISTHGHNPSQSLMSSF